MELGDKVLLNWDFEGIAAGTKGEVIEIDSEFYVVAFPNATLEINSHVYDLGDMFKVIDSQEK